MWDKYKRVLLSNLELCCVMPVERARRDALHSTVLCLEGMGELRKNKAVDRVLRRSMEASILAVVDDSEPGGVAQSSSIDGIIERSRRLMATQVGCNEPAQINV